MVKEVALLIRVRIGCEGGVDARWCKGWPDGVAEVCDILLPKHKAVYLWFTRAPVTSHEYLLTLAYKHVL